MKSILIAIALVMTTTAAYAYDSGSSYTERYLQRQKDEAMFGSSSRTDQNNNNSRRQSGWEPVRYSGSSSGSDCTNVARLMGCQ